MHNRAFFGAFKTVFVASLVLVTLGGFLPEAEAEGRAVVYNFDGKASIVRNHKTIPVDLDMRLLEGDLLRTEADGFVDTTLNGIVGVRLLASGESQLLNSSEGDMTLKTQGGDFLVNMKALSTGSSFRIITPSATVLVNHTLPGTQFLVRVRKDAQGEPFTTVISKKNTVYVNIERSSATVSVLEGQALHISLESFIPPVRLATEEEDTAAGKALSVYVSN